MSYFALAAAATAALSTLATTAGDAKPAPFFPAANSNAGFDGLRIGAPTATRLGAPTGTGREVIETRGGD